MSLSLLRGWGQLRSRNEFNGERFGKRKHEMLICQKGVKMGLEPGRQKK